MLLHSGAVWWDPFHSSQPDCLLEVYAKHIRRADRLPIQPGLHGQPWPAHQRADLSACWRRSHQHAVAAQLHLVRWYWCCKTLLPYQKQRALNSFSHCRNSEQNKCLWKLSDISEKSENEGDSSFSSFVFTGFPLNLILREGDWWEKKSCWQVNVFVFDPRGRIPQGQVWIVKWSIKPLHPGSAVYERGEHPVRGRYGAAGGWIQTFSQQEEVCHRYDLFPISPTLPDVGSLNTPTTQTCTPLVLSLGRYMADCWGDPTRNNNKKRKEEKNLNSTRLPEHLQHLSTVRLLPGKWESHYNKTALSIEHCLKKKEKDDELSGNV